MDQPQTKNDRISLLDLFRECCKYGDLSTMKHLHEAHVITDYEVRMFNNFALKLAKKYEHPTTVMWLQETFDLATPPMLKAEQRQLVKRRIPCPLRALPLPGVGHLAHV